MATRARPGASMSTPRVCSDPAYDAWPPSGACRWQRSSASEPLVVPAPALVEGLTLADHRRVGELVDRHADSDIGFVDAAVRAIVERLDEPKLVTLDRRHFGLIRPRHRESIDLSPA